MPKYLTRSARVAVTAALLSAAGLTSTALADETVVDRSAFSTTVQVGDAFKTRTYPEQINFKDDEGDWAAINRSLESRSDGSVRPAAVDGDAVIPSTLRKPVVLEHDGRTVSFRLLGADVDADRDVSGTKASFDGALAGVDVSYKVRPNGLKELLELSSSSSARSFSYDVRADSDLVAAIVGGDLVFKDSAGTERFRVAAPLAWDSADPSDAANALTLSVSKTADRQWRLTMRADDKWLDDPARVYPVTLDPDYVWVPDYYWIDGYMRFHGANQDCQLAGGSQAGQNLCAGTSLQIGYGNNRPYKSLMKFNIAAAIPAYANATASRFLAWQPSSSINKAPVSSRLRTVTTDWDNTATWDVSKTGTRWASSGGGGDVSTDPNLTGTPITIGSSGYWSYWPAPLAAVNGWIKRTLPNYGFQISTDTTYPNVINAYGFTSTDGAQQSWPALEVTWVPDTTGPTGVVPNVGPGAADQSFISGSQPLTINASAQDDASGVAKLELLVDGSTVAATAAIGCPGTLCPLSANAPLTMATSGLAEGAHTLALRATDGAGNLTTTSPWNVYADRTAPALGGPVGAAPLAGSLSAVSWDSDDPDLADGNNGSGVATEAIRFQETNGTWSSWETRDGSIETTRSGNLTLQLRFADAVGNTVDLAPTAVTIDNPDISGDEMDLEDPADDDCASAYSAAYCARAAGTGPATFSAAAARRQTAAWGLADVDKAFLTGDVSKSYLESDIVDALTDGDRGSLDHVRMLVAYNIMDKTGNRWSYPGRKAALFKALTKAEELKIPVMISFEAGCRNDADYMACSGQTKVGPNGEPPNMLSSKVPAQKAVNGTAKKIMKTLGQELPDAVGENVQWFGVWNEPTNGNQPFSEANDGTKKGAGYKRLTRLTEEMTNPTNSVCVKYDCQIVTAEVEILAPGRSQPALTNQYATYLRWFKGAKAQSQEQIGFYGAHDYSEVFRTGSKANASASGSRLATWMRKLPNSADVWLPEIGSCRRRKTSPGKRMV